MIFILIFILIFICSVSLVFLTAVGTAFLRRTGSISAAAAVVVAAAAAFLRPSFNARRPPLSTPSLPPRFNPLSCSPLFSFLKNSLDKSLEFSAVNVFPRYNTADAVSEALATVAAAPSATKVAKLTFISHLIPPLALPPSCPSETTSSATPPYSLSLSLSLSLSSSAKKQKNEKMSSYGDLWRR